MRNCRKCNLKISEGKLYCPTCLSDNKKASYKKANAKRGAISKNSYLKRNPGQKLFQIQRQRIIVARGNNPTQIKTKEIIGCDHFILQKHIEAQFKEGMSWENYGLKTWHIDHIKPISLFNLNNDNELIACFNYQNLQPLWASENIQKRNKY